MPKLVLVKARDLSYSFQMYMGNAWMGRQKRARWEMNR